MRTSFWNLTSLEWKAAIHAERQARQERQQAATLEQALARRDSVLADRESVAGRLEKDLTARERAVKDREKTTLDGACVMAAMLARTRRRVVREMRSVIVVSGR